MTVDHFDRDEGAEFLRLVPQATLFPLTVQDGLPAGHWGSLEPGERIHADDPRQGYGIACGARSGGLVVLDVDQKHGKDGAAALRALEAEWCALPPTLTVGSPSGGVHLYFYHPGKFQSNAGRIGIGLDIRAEGGYVRIPGSPHPRHAGHFRLTRAFAPAMLPPRWADKLPRQGSALPVDLAPLEAGTDVEPDELRARLVRLVRGKRGDLWTAWRSVSRGERFVKVAPDAPQGGVDNFLQRLLGVLASEWPEVSDRSFGDLIAPSLGILVEDDRAQGNPTYSLADLTCKWARARQHAAENRARAAKAEEWTSDLVASVQGALPLLVAHTGYYYLRPAEPCAAYIGPKVRADLWLTARDVWGASDGPDVYREAKNGPVRMGADDLLERYGLSVEKVVHDTDAREARIEDRALVLPAAPIKRKAREHPDVAAWLQAYDPTGHLEDWIACITDLKYAAPALWLTGEGGIGKSLLAAGLAKIWGSIPTPMHVAFAAFNDALLHCPLIEAAEEIPKNFRGFQDTEKLKELITETERKINEKHKPIRDVLGAVRVVLSSNNTNLIRNSGDLTAEDAHALADRFVHVHVDATRAREIREVLPDPRTIQTHWIDGGRIAEHALWLAETRTVAFGPRLRMVPHAEGLRQLFLIQPGAGFAVCAAAYRWLLTAAAAKEAPNGAPWAFINGTVCATADAVLNRLPDDAKRTTRRSVGQALQRIGERRGDLWTIPTWALRTWAHTEAFGSPERLEKALAAMEEKC